MTRGSHPGLMTQPPAPSLGTGGASLRLGVLHPDREARARAAKRLAELGYDVREAESVHLLFSGEEDVDAVLFHPPTDGEPWRGALERAVEAARGRPVVFVSKRRDPSEAVDTLRHGAAEYITESLDPSQFQRDLEEAIRAASSEQEVAAPAAAAPAQESVREDAFITASPQMEALRRTAVRLADSDVTVLIRGESGVGKEVLAKHIHAHSNRVQGPFVKVNCAALPEQLLESELFGFEQGAFTGAMTARQGKFELASGGTILLDEIAEMRVSLQAKLLHVLQDGVFTRLGGRKEMTSDVRVLSATNRNLEKEIERGTFREDLYFRLKVIDLVIPALRDRREDILPLIHHFLRLYSEQYARPMPELSYHFLQRLIEHPWPGNVRELSNLMKGLVILNSTDWAIDQMERSSRDLAQTTPSPVPTAVDSPESFELAATVPPPSPPVPEPATPLPLEERPSLIDVGRRAARAAERELLAQTLQETRWNRRKAAKLLKVSYKTLLNKIKDFELAPAD